LNDGCGKKQHNNALDQVEKPHDHIKADQFLELDIHTDSLLS
jgi:hypothetical protein